MPQETKSWSELFKASAVNWVDKNKDIVAARAPGVDVDKLIKTLKGADSAFSIVRALEDSPCVGVEETARLCRSFVISLEHNRESGFHTPPVVKPSKQSVFRAARKAAQVV